jgi:hypothetical protein
MSELPPQTLDMFDQVPVPIVNAEKAATKSNTPTPFKKYKTPIYAPNIFGPQPKTDMSLKQIESIVAANQVDEKLKIPEGMEQIKIPISIQDLIKKYREGFEEATTFEIGSDAKLKLHPSLNAPKVTVELKF